MRQFSVVIPTYNEAENIEEFIITVSEILDNIDFELIIVDDNSPDKTWALAKNISKNMDNVKVIVRDDKRDLSRSILRGINESRSEKIAVIDADFQHPPEKLIDLYHNLSDSDIVICSRRMYEGRVESWTLSRKLISRAAELIAKTLFKELYDVTDPLSGYFGLNKNILRKTKLEPEGYKLLIEILIKTNYDSLKEIPYTFYDRDRGSSSIGFTEYVKYLKHLFKLKLNRNQFT